LYGCDAGVTIAIGLAAGAATFYTGDLLIDRMGGANRKHPSGTDQGESPLAIVLGIVLDGIPESIVIGLTLGRRFCLPCLAYFELVQPRFGEGPLEDARPPRFANLVGTVFLAAATVFYAAGLGVAGAVLGALVAGLALLAAATGFCTGCEAYKLGSLLIGRPFVSCPLPTQPGTRSE